MMRSYRLPTTANRGKLDAVAAVLPWWQRGLVHVQYLQVCKLKAGTAHLGWLGGQEAQSLPPYLSQRQWKSVVNQVNAALTSWRETAKIGLREMIRMQPLDDEKLREELYRINVYMAWWAKDNVIDARHGIVVSNQAMSISAMLVKEWLRRNPFPNLSRARTMAMDGPIAKVSTSTNSHAEFWVKVTTLEKRKPVNIPLQGYEYFNKADGEVRNFCQIHVSESGTVSFVLVKKSLPTPQRDRGESLGLDWGLKNTFATSDGQLLGRGLYRWLCQRDKELNELGATLQRQGICPSRSKRYLKLNLRIREHVRNEVCRVLNRLADKDIRELVVEELDFRMGGLSARLNRIMGRAGRAAVRAKFASIVQTHGITVTRVNPAHTSRCCSGCGYVDKKNRPSQERFMCRFCGKRLPADINAARNIRGRSADSNGHRGQSREQVLAEMDRLFRTRWRFEPTLLRERHARGCSTASSPQRRKPSRSTRTSPIRILHS
ncbi:transposase [Nocardia sp. ET3-3]|uniref:Transposase n=1 Tax=Nocardia terrae TaxID=2675851 RepID=A0A7K1UYJ3_9NOCA|nr:zinc ribbon domain-containing protein [Nocardia terrae]MVU79341.1 transposase [Nocardia terrae]